MVTGHRIVNLHSMEHMYSVEKRHVDKTDNVGRFEFIRKTCPCNVYPLEPHFYLVKLGFAGVYMNLFFLFLLQNIDCGYSLEPPRRGGRGGSNMYPQSMV